MSFAERLANTRVNYRCGNCIGRWKPCHSCRCATWIANDGYIKVYDRQDWLRRNVLTMKVNLGLAPEWEGAVWL